MSRGAVGHGLCKKTIQAKDLAEAMVLMHDTIVFFQNTYGYLQVHLSQTSDPKMNFFKGTYKLKI